MIQSMSYVLHLCDCTVPYCASLKAWNWVEAGQHLNGSHPRSSSWPNHNVSILSGNCFFFDVRKVICCIGWRHHPSGSNHGSTKFAWELGNLGTLELGNLGIRELGNLGIRELGNLGSWELGNLETWELRNF